MAAEHATRSRESIVRSLKASYLLRKVAEAERIVVTEAEVDGQVRAFAARQGWREERARTYMEERGMIRALRDDMRESKTEDFLAEHGRVTEIPPDEFAKRHAHAEMPEVEEAPGGAEI